MAAAFASRRFSNQSGCAHVSYLISGRVFAGSVSGVGVPVGISYGDVLGAGEAAAKAISFNDRLR
ncbi:MAG: phosphoribosylformylglycinamidine synthase subunit PurQ [Porticoccaceae bacterium]